MAERIEIGYTPAAGVGVLGIYHKYIIYTDNQGNQFYARGGPGYSGPGAGVGGFGEYSTSDFGNIKTESGRYEPGTPDWDRARDPANPDPTAVPHPRETIRVGDDLSFDWQRIQQEMQDIDARDVPYIPHKANSNSAVDEALRRVGLPAPVLDGPRDYWAPASDVDLPGSGDPNIIPTDPIPTPETPSFLRDLFEWARHKAHSGAQGLPGTWEAEGWGGIDPYGVNDPFHNGARTRPPVARDPLAIDLDGDGIETVGSATNPSSSTTTPTASAPAPAGSARTTPGWCSTATPTA